MAYIVDRFTPDMLCTRDFSLVRFTVVDPATIPTDVFSAISDANMTRVISGILGFELRNKSDSAYISDENDVLYIADYHGPNLEEGATSVPKGAIAFYKVTTKPQGCSGCSNYLCGDCYSCGWMHGE